MKLLLSWARDFVDITASPQQVADTMALRGFEVASIEHLGDDAVIDFEVTANRPDCLSVAGLAREIATAFDLPYRELSKHVGALADLEVLASPTTTTEAVFSVMAADLAVHIEAAELCPRYAAAMADVSPTNSPTRDRSLSTNSLVVLWQPARPYAAKVRRSAFWLGRHSGS